MTWRVKLMGEHNGSHTLYFTFPTLYVTSTCAERKPLQDGTAPSSVYLSAGLTIRTLWRGSNSGSSPAQLCLAEAFARIVRFRSDTAPRYTCSIQLLQLTMPHATATFNGKVIAEADAFEQVEGNVYFPPDSVKGKAALTDATLTTFCPWKGTASYYDITVDGQTCADSSKRGNC